MTRQATIESWRSDRIEELSGKLRGLRAQRSEGDWFVGAEISEIEEQLEADRMAAEWQRRTFERIMSLCKPLVTTESEQWVNQGGGLRERRIVRETTTPEGCWNRLSDRLPPATRFGRWLTALQQAGLISEADARSIDLTEPVHPGVLKRRQEAVEERRQFEQAWSRLFEEVERHAHAGAWSKRECLAIWNTGKYTRTIDDLNRFATHLGRKHYLPAPFYTPRGVFDAVGKLLQGGKQ